MADDHKNDEKATGGTQDNGTQDNGTEAISNGMNSRPRNETIAQTGAGIPNDSSSPVDIDEEEEKRIEKSIRSL